jgi:hypothetical protein
MVKIVSVTRFVQGRLELRLNNGYRNQKKPNMAKVPPAAARLAQPLPRMSLPNKSTSSAIANINGIMALAMRRDAKSIKKWDTVPRSTIR